MRTGAPKTGCQASRKGQVSHGAGDGRSGLGLTRIPHLRYALFMSGLAAVLSSPALHRMSLSGAADKKSNPC
ncbi:hypothetical protein MTP99_011735 [Tenebrio molitor]|jgi:hypothetical protein|nr:hypothetical protein MTP99_011735 [Tenebrio molitor]